MVLLYNVCKYVDDVTDILIKLKYGRWALPSGKRNKFTWKQGEVNKTTDPYAHIEKE